MTTLPQVISLGCLSSMQSSAHYLSLLQLGMALSSALIFLIFVLFCFVFCSKLQKTKRDIRWLQGATGEWFEEIQRKKFCNETDVNQMLKPPLTYRLQKGMAKNGENKNKFCFKLPLLCFVV